MSNPNTMSTKLNAEELAEKRYKDEHQPDYVINVGPFQWVRLGYSTAIREVAQRLADERDSLRKALERVCELVGMAPWIEDPPMKGRFLDEMDKARKVLAKYKK